MKPSATPAKLVASAIAGVEPHELVQLLELMGAAVFRVSAADFGVSFVGGRAFELLGEPARLERHGDAFWRALVPAPDLEAVLGAIAAVATDGTARTLEHRAELPGRPGGWVRTSLFRPHGSEELLGAMVDITAARENERHWGEVESWLSTLGETLPFDFWICDRDGRCLLQNPASIKRHGNVVGRKVDEWEPSLALALRGETHREELTDVGPHGERYLVRVVSPVLRDGEIEGALGVDLDVTPLKQTEARLRASMAELAEAQDALVRKQRMAALGEMAAVVAHEIRNPLGAIANSAALMSREARFSSDALEVCRIIRDEVGRLDRLVVALLDFARPLNLQLAALPLEHAVEDAISHTLMTEEAKGRVKVIQEVEPGLLPVRADGLLLQLVLTNVMRNAVQAMPTGGELHVKLSNDRPQYARVTITDTGGGIPEGIRARIFQPFVTTRSTGSGLGLAIVKRIVEEHGGEVELRSNEPRGCTCVIRMPVVGAP